jgi:hypothetical protein
VSAAFYYVRSGELVAPPALSDRAGVEYAIFATGPPALE